MELTTKQIFGLALSCSLLATLNAGMVQAASHYTPPGSAEDGAAGAADAGSSAVASSTTTPGTVTTRVSGTASQILTKIEDELLECSYPADSEEQRLQRLEKFVFGEKKTGSTKDRLQALYQAMLNHKTAHQTQSAPPVAPPASAASGANGSTPSTASGSGGANGDGAAYGNLGYGSYPRVTQLEQQILGYSYLNEPLPQRIARLEMKKFGKVTPGDDYGERIDALDKATPELAKANADDGQDSGATAGSGSDVPVAPSYKAGSGSGQSNSAYVSQTAEQNSGDIGSYPRVSALEQKVFGTTYEKDTLPARVARLEEKEFGKASSDDDDYGARIDRLDKKVKPKMEVASDDSSSGGGGGGNRGSGGGSLGRTMLGLLGSAVGMGMPGMGGLGMMGMAPGLGSGIGYGVDPRAGRGGGGQDSSPKPSAPVIQNPFASGSLPVSGVEDKTNAMEKFVFGKEQPNKPLEERVARLEKKLAPWEHHTANQDINSRINHLWQVLQAANSPSSTAAKPAATGSPANGATAAAKGAQTAATPATGTQTASGAQAAGPQAPGSTANAPATANGAATAPKYLPAPARPRPAYVAPPAVAGKQDITH